MAVWQWRFVLRVDGMKRGVKGEFYLAESLLYHDGKGKEDVISFAS